MAYVREPWHRHCIGIGGICSKFQQKPHKIKTFYDRVRANTGQCAQFRHLFGDNFWQIGAVAAPTLLASVPDMKCPSQKGFTLIELILVVVVAGLIATVAVPSLMKARDAADSSVAVAQLRSMHTNQSMYRIQNSRYANLPELNAFAGNSHGRTVGTTLRHRDFIFLMFPNPSPSTLRNDYQIIGYRIREGRVIAQHNMAEDGLIRTIIR